MARLLLDAMCGGLRAYLRMCGHDAAYALERDVEADRAVSALASREDRIVVTRDRQLARGADRSLLLTEREPVDQLVELAAAGLDLTLDAEASRCGRCNGRLEPTERDDSTPEYVPDDRSELRRCRECGQLFWNGSHWERVERTLAEVRERTETG